MIIFGFGNFTFYFGSLQNSLEHFMPVQPPKPMRKSFSFRRFLWWFLLGFVVSSTSLNLWVVVGGEGVVVVVVVGVVVFGSEPLPWMTFCFKGQQILGMLFVKPQENFERNFSFSFVIWFSRIFSTASHLVISIHCPGWLSLAWHVSGVPVSVLTSPGRWNARPGVTRSSSRGVIMCDVTC